MSNSISSLEGILSSKCAAIVIILLFSFGCYFNTLFNDFVYDDRDQVIENHWIRDAKYIPDIFLLDVWAFMGEVPSNYYRPLMHITYMINYHIFGLRPWGFHLTNVIIHFGVSILVFLIVSLFITQQMSLIFAFASAILFTTHPIHTEAVAWISGIPELAFTFFYLLSFYLYVRVDGGWGMKYTLSILFFFLATLYKETALTLPLFLLVYDYSLSKGSTSKPSRFSFSLSLRRFIPYLMMVGLYFILRTYAIGGFVPLKRHVGLTNYEYFINIFPLFLQYIEKLILPINLNAFHVLSPISSMLGLKGIIALTLTLAFIGFIYLSRKIKRMIFVSLLWIVIPLLSVLYIPALGENTLAERYLYLPSVGFVVLLSIATEKIYALRVLRDATTPAIVSILILITGLYTIGTVKRNYAWRNNYVLWQDTVKKSPGEALPNNNLGIAYKDKGLIDEAIEHYKTALRLRPDYPLAHNNLGIAYKDKGSIDKAIEHHLIAIKLRPSFPKAHNNLGVAYYAKGSIGKTIEHYKTALRLNPEYAEAHSNLAISYQYKGLFDKALKHHKLALKLKPDFPRGHNNLGIYYSNTGVKDKAMEHFQIALKLDPDFPEAHYNLGIEHHTSGLVDVAIEHYKRALNLKPDYAKAHHNLAVAYENKGMNDKAVEHYQIVIKLRPDYTAAEDNIARILGDKRLKELD